MKKKLKPGSYKKIFIQKETLMEDMNKRVGNDDIGFENLMGQQGQKCVMNKNEELLIYIRIRIFGIRW